MSGERPPLVLLHGWAAGPSVFDVIIPALADRFDVLNVAMPGYDGNECDASADLDALCDDLRERTPEGATWLAWSTGALAALTLAAGPRPHVARLNAVAPVVRFPRSRDWPCGADAGLLADFRIGVAEDIERLLARFARMATFPDGGRNGASFFADACRGSAASARTLAAGLDLLAGADVRRLLPEVRVPVTVFHGERDAVVSVESSRRAAVSIPNATLSVIPDAGHAPFLTVPDGFVTRFEHDGRY